MKNFLKSLFVGGLLALGAALPASASSTWLCAPEQSNAANASRTIGGTSSAVPSGTIYVLNSKGCGLIAQGDTGYFVSQGYTQGSPVQTATFTTGVLTGTTSVQFLPSLPAGTVIRDIIVDNTTANAVTGGVDIGKTSGAADIVSALTCGASCLTFVADSALLLRVFSKTAQQAVWITGHTAGNSANLTVTIVYEYF